MWLRITCVGLCNIGKSNMCMCAVAHSQGGLEKFVYVGLGSLSENACVMKYESFGFGCGSRSKLFITNHIT